METSQLAEYSGDLNNEYLNYQLKLVCCSDAWLKFFIQAIRQTTYNLNNKLLVLHESQDLSNKPFNDGTGLDLLNTDLVFIQIPL